MLFISTFASFLVAASTLLAPAQAEDISITSSLRSRVARNIPEARQGFQEFKISDVYINTYEPGKYSIENRQIAFYFADPNNKSSTVCTARWHDPSTSNSTLPSGEKHPDTKPTSYVNCGFNGKQEIYQFYFSQYKSLNDFQLQLRHSYSDPVKYPPPYDTIGLFATVDVKLVCSNGEGQQGCYLPPGSLGLNAYINGATL